MSKKKPEWSYITDSYEESVVISKLKENPDGSVTVHAQIDLSGPDGTIYSTNRVLRLKRDE